MPRIQRNQNAAVIELSIPLRLSRGGDDSDDDDSCCICTQGFCSGETCLNSLTHLRCCSQAICCGCALKVAKRCKCADECEAVIANCPFCREIAALGALDIFLGTRATCKICVKLAAAEAVATPAPAEDAELATG